MSVSAVYDVAGNGPHLAMELALRGVSHADAPRLAGEDRASEGAG